MAASSPRCRGMWRNGLDRPGGPFVRLCAVSLVRGDHAIPVCRDRGMDRHAAHAPAWRSLWA